MATKNLTNHMRFTNRLLHFSLAILAICLCIALYGIGDDREQGAVYRILFLHVPIAWSSFVWTFVGGASAIGGFFAKRPERLDALSCSAMTISCLLSFLVLVTGSLWGKATWGVWWDWEPRLTASLVMFLIGAGYLTLRSFTPEKQLRARLSAMVAILGVINIPLVYFSVNLWRSLHQPQTFVRSAQNVSSDIQYTLIACSLSFLLFSWALVRLTKEYYLLKNILEEGGSW